MIQIILTIIVILIVIATFKKIFRLSLKVFSVLLMVVLAISMGPFFLVGFICERLCAVFRIRALLSYFLTVITWALVYVLEVSGIQYDPDSFNLTSIKLSFPAFFFTLMLYGHWAQRGVERRSEPLNLFRKNHSNFYLYFFTAFFFLVVAVLTRDFFRYLDWSLESVWYVGMVSYGITVLLQLYALSQDFGRKELSEKIHDQLTNLEKLNSTAYLQELTKDSALDSEHVETLFQGIAAKQINTATIVEIELNESYWFFNRPWYEMCMVEVNTILAKDIQHHEDELITVIQKYFGLPDSDSKDFINRYLDFGSYYDFKNGHYFVPYSHSDHLNTCVSCGLTEVVDERCKGEWHCSAVCKETEDVCITIKNKPIDNFMVEAASNGFVLMGGAQAWTENLKLFATGAQGHGHAAEQGNNRIDRLMFRDAKVIGGDNAANGPDRIANGQQIQTKYHSTGARSVGKAFANKNDNGMYRYLDDSGKPMQLEVPKDQYQKAIETMENKIRNGKVSGITDPNDAVKLIRKGHLTYAQAQNITKFGNFESIVYDISEGAIVSASAAGISFGISSLIYYLNTKDEKEAIRIAMIQAGNTFGKILTIFVTTQQLHRLSSIQDALKYVDTGKLSPTVRNVLQKGFGVSKTGINKALRGTLVTSVVVVAVTTGPDILKLVRGRISQAQFLKNLVVVSSGMTGGVIGSVAGGFLFSSMGPVGIFMGRTAGGIIGGIIASTISNKIANNLIEEDRVKILKIIQIQIEYLAISFILTAEEIDNLNTNLDKIITQETLEVIHAAGDQRRAMANFFLKPVLVTVIKQRPTLSYGINDVIDACDDWAA